MNKTLSQNFVCSHEKMKINWSQTVVTYFSKLEIKDLRKLKKIQLINFWAKLIKFDISKV